VNIEESLWLWICILS